MLVNKSKTRQFKAGEFIEDGISIYVLDESGKKKREYNLDGCVVQKISIGDLDAQGSAVLIERLEVSYESYTEE